ncbi:hypothetical protein VTN49DRAFT_5149 [Thermomyces lanuginosus]|mgnify:CR=1 FL=1|uniref:uncharacterized protein n=1 Tax=Thermomyces lanuginosus TaxID=5541 RepID=UPI0037428B9F
MNTARSIPRLRLSHPFLRRRFPRRQFSTPSPSPPPAGDAHSRLHRLNARLPRSLQRYTSPLLHAPVAHVTSFLILHEITAVVPLLTLLAGFHYLEWLPDLMTGENTPWSEGVKRLGKWMAKRGWVDRGDVDAAAAATAVEGSAGGEKEVVNANRGARLVLEFAAAYAVTKALLPVRIAASVWATPWFARVVVSPIGRGFARVFRRS